jgi:hypothetical protein
MRFAFSIIVLFLVSCGTSRRFGTTIVRDENNPCLLHMIIQVAVEGTPADLAAVKSELESCFNRECFIPCEDDSTRGCKVKMSVTVKSFAELKEEEQGAYHYVYMVDNDGEPSNAYLGRPNDGASSGTWRRNAHPGTYCHEVLHFCGLEDKYCARIYDPVRDSAVVERHCVPPPDPGANCCAPSRDDKRCTAPCAGHEDDIMGSSWAGMTCDNIMDVLGKAGYGECPRSCCSSDSTFSRPLPEYYLTPGYYNFGSGGNKLGTFGIGVGGTKWTGSGLGITIEGGAYFHEEKKEEVKENNSVSHLIGGVSYSPSAPGGDWQVAGHLLGGIAFHKQRVTIPGFESNEQNATSPMLNLGISIDKRISRTLNWRLLRLDYSPTFFNDETQHNFRAGTGIVWIPGRN